MNLDEVTGAMLQDLDELTHQVRVIRPLDVEVLRQVENELFGERVFSSNAIEGSTLTIRETRLVLQAKAVIDIEKKREAQEVLGLGEASRRIEQLLDPDSEGAWHDVSKFLEVHETLMTGVNDSIAGVLRHREVMILGASRQPPGSHEVSDLIDTFFQYMIEADGKIGGLILATWVHWAIARIHPFEDGNGRMARLWQDMILLRDQYTVAIVRPQDRSLYYEVLSRADEGDFNPLAQLLCQRVMSTLQVYLNAQESADNLQTWAGELVGESTTRDAERRKLGYQRWFHAVEQLRDSFERCASVINRGHDASLELQYQSYDIIDQPTWETLSGGGRAARTWFFRLDFRKNDTFVRYFFYFGRHYRRLEDASVESAGPFVAVLVSQQRPGESNATGLDEMTNTPISLREMIILDKQIVARRVNQVTSEMSYDRGAKALEIAKEFCSEVILKVLT